MQAQRLLENLQAQQHKNPDEFFGITSLLEQRQGESRPAAQDKEQS